MRQFAQLPYPMLQISESNAVAFLQRIVDEARPGKPPVIVSEVAGGGVVLSCLGCSRQQVFGTLLGLSHMIVSAVGGNTWRSYTLADNAGSVVIDVPAVTAALALLHDRANEA
jgi:hypothetical protein